MVGQRLPCQNPDQEPKVVEPVERKPGPANSKPGMLEVGSEESGVDTPTLVLGEVDALSAGRGWSLERCPWAEFDMIQAMAAQLATIMQHLVRVASSMGSTELATLKHDVPPPSTEESINIPSTSLWATPLTVHDTPWRVFTRGSRKVVWPSKSKE